MKGIAVGLVLAVLVIGALVGGVVEASAIGEQNPNETPDSAMSLGAFGEQGRAVWVDANMDYPGDNDWYSFVVESTVDLTISCESAVAKTKIVLFDRQEGGAITFKAAGETSLRQEKLPRGTYAVQVSMANLSTGKYQLFVSTVRESEPNDSPGDADFVGSFDGTTLRVEASIDYVSDFDRFRFDLPVVVSGAVAIAVNGPKDDDSFLTLLSLDPVTGTLELVAADDDSGQGMWSLISMPLQTGSYMVVVSSMRRGATIDGYTLSVSAEPTPHEPNDSCLSPYDLGSIQASANIRVDSTSSVDDLDYFSFTLEGEALLTLSTSETRGSVGNTTLYLHDSGCGETLGVSVNRSEENLWSRTSVAVSPGTYVALVEPSLFWSSGTFWYALEISAQPAPTATAEQEPNGSLREATPLGVLPARARGRVGAGDDAKDIFQFTLAASGTVFISVSGAGDQDSYLSLFSESGSEIASDDDSGVGAWSQLEAELEPGVYYVIVESFAGETVEYELLITP